MPLKPKQAYRTELSINDIRSRAWNATQGSEQSYKYLQEQNKKLAKIANSRLRALEAAGYDMFVYDSAITYLSNHGLKRFSTKLAPSTDWRGMVEQLQELITFINAETSTVAGAKKGLDKKIQKVSEFTGHTYTDEEKYQLGRLMGVDSVSTLLREVRGDSAEVIEVLEELAMPDVDAEPLRTIIDKHLQGYNPFEENAFISNLDYLNYDEMMDEIRKAYNLDNNED